MPSPLLPLAAGIAAVRVSRAAAEAEVLRTRPRSRVPVNGLAEPRGAFVSVHCGSALRGCVGQVQPREPLRDVLEDAARSAVRDPRLEPVRPSELSQVTLEVSVLTPARPLPAAHSEALAERVRIGTDGLMVVAGRRRGLLLPQVAVEHGFTAAQFLSATCDKAGLDPEAWRENAALQWRVFQAQVFRELEPRGDVAEKRDERPELV